MQFYINNAKFTTVFRDATPEELAERTKGLPSADDLDAVMSEQQIAQSTAQKFRVVK